MVKRFIFKKIKDGSFSRKPIVTSSKIEKVEEKPFIEIKEEPVIKLEEVIENKEEIKEDIVMDTKEKIQMAAAVLGNEQPKIKKVKKDKGLIERTESSITILTEDNRELLKD